MNQKKKWWNKVNWYSKSLTLILLFAIFILGFYFGSKSQKDADELSRLVQRNTENFFNLPITKSDNLNIEQIKNAAYGDVALEDGIFTESGKSTTTLEKFAFGDFDSDGKGDAAAILSTYSGGTGTFRSLAILLNKGGKPEFLTSLFIGDRVQINSISMDRGEVALDWIVHGPDDPMCCPTLHKQSIFKLNEGKLKETSFSISGD
jgi:hypothetical protein